MLNPASSFTARASTIFKRFYSIPVSKPKRKRINPSLGFDYFLETYKSRQLWKFIVRSAYKIPSKEQRRELIDWARVDFVQHRNEKDVEKIKYLVSQGAREVNVMARSLALPTAEFKFKVPEIEFKSENEKED